MLTGAPAAGSFQPIDFAASIARLNASTERMSGLGAPSRTNTPTPTLAISAWLPAVILPSFSSIAICAAEAISTSAASPLRMRCVMPPMVPSKSKLTLCREACSNFGMSSAIAVSTAEPDRIFISAATTGVAAARLSKKHRTVSARRVRIMTRLPLWLRQLAQRKSRDVAQQRDEAVGLVLRRQATFFRGRCRGIPHGAIGIEVLRDPSEGVRADGPQMLKAFLHLGALRWKQLRLAHVHQIGPEMEHERRLDVAGVDAVDKVEVGIKPRGQPETAPLGGDDEHAEAHAQLPRDDADDIDVAAVRVGNHHLAQAGAMHAFADLDPAAHEIIRQMADGAGGTQMLVGLSDRLHRQDEHAEIIG